MNDNKVQQQIDALAALPAEQWDAALDACPRDMAFAVVFEHVRGFADDYDLQPSDIMAMMNAGKLAAGVLWPNSKARWLA